MEVEFSVKQVHDIGVNVLLILVKRAIFNEKSGMIAPKWALEAQSAGSSSLCAVVTFQFVR